MKKTTYIIKDECFLTPNQVTALFRRALESFVAYQARNHAGDWNDKDIFNEFDFANYDGRLYALGNASLGPPDFQSCNTYRYSSASDRWRDLDQRPPAGLIDPKRVEAMRIAWES